MSEEIFGVDGYVILDHASLGNPSVHAQSIEIFLESVVTPTLESLNDKLRQAEFNDDDSYVFVHEELAELHHITVQSFILAVQSLWERALRRTLVEADKRMFAGSQIEAIQGAHWAEQGKGLQYYFHRIYGFSLANMYAYSDLNILQTLGNAIRHGNGKSTTRLYSLAPNLWQMWTPPGTIIKAGPFTVETAKSQSPYPPFESITLTEDLLHQMISSVLDFWMDLESLRCYSLRRIAEGTLRSLAEWQEERINRRSNRVWNVESS